MTWQWSDGAGSGSTDGLTVPRNRLDRGSVLVVALVILAWVLTAAWLIRDLRDDPCPPAPAVCFNPDHHDQPTSDDLLRLRDKAEELADQTPSEVPVVSGDSTWV